MFQDVKDRCFFKLLALLTNILNNFNLYSSYVAFMFVFSRLLFLAPITFT